MSRAVAVAPPSAKTDASRSPAPPLRAKPSAVHAPPVVGLNGGSPLPPTLRRRFLNYEAQQNDFTIELGRRDGISYHHGHRESGWRVTLADTGQLSMTGARIKCASKYLGDHTRFMLTYGDGLADVDIGALLEFHRRSKTIGTVTGVRPSSRFGELLTDGDRVVQFSEKPRMRSSLINGGFFVFERRFIDYLRDDIDCVLEREPLERLAADDQLAVYAHTGFWQCMDTYRDHQLLNQLWESGSPPWKVW